MILVLEIDDAAVKQVVAAVPDGSVAWGGDFRTLQQAQEAIRDELARRAQGAT